MWINGSRVNSYLLPQGSCVLVVIAHLSQGPGARALTLWQVNPFSHSKLSPLVMVLPGGYLPVGMLGCEVLSVCSWLILWTSLDLGGVSKSWLWSGVRASHSAPLKEMLAGGMREFMRTRQPLMCLLSSLESCLGASGSDWAQRRKGISWEAARDYKVWRPCGQEWWQGEIKQRTDPEYEEGGGWNFGWGRVVKLHLDVKPVTLAG